MMGVGHNDENINSIGIQASVTGLVTASGWDDCNNITELKLFTTDEDEYIIENGISYIGVLRKFIHAKGQIKNDMYGGKSIEIKEFKVVEQGIGEGFPAEF
jgi:hypothetical protein